jgi:hypothetical protein
MRYPILHSRPLDSCHVLLDIRRRPMGSVCKTIVLPTKEQEVSGTYLVQSSYLSWSSHRTTKITTHTRQTYIYSIQLIPTLLFLITLPASVYTGADMYSCNDIYKRCKKEPPMMPHSLSQTRPQTPLVRSCHDVVSNQNAVSLKSAETERTKERKS